VLNKLAKSQQPKAKIRALKKIWTGGPAAFGAFTQTCGIKYGKADERPVKDRDALPAFGKVPAEHLGAMGARRTRRKRLRQYATAPRALSMPVEQNRGRDELQIRGKVAGKAALPKQLTRVIGTSSEPPRAIQMPPSFWSQIGSPTQ